MNKLEKLLIDWEDTPKKNKKIRSFFKKECLKIKIKNMLEKIKKLIVNNQWNIVSILLFTFFFIILLRSMQISQQNLAKAKEELWVYRKTSVIEYREQYKKALIEAKNLEREQEEMNKKILELKKQEETKKWKAECIMNWINDFLTKEKEIDCDNRMIEIAEGK